MLRVIDEEGNFVGMLKTREALQKSEEAGLDLVLIAPHARPAVARIIDYKKFLYLQEKKRKEAKKGSKKGQTKDIKLSLFIAKGDRDRFLKKTKEFLEKGHQVRLNLNLRGRELGKKPMAIESLKQFITDLGDNVNVSKEPRVEGRVIRAVVSQLKKK